MSSNVSSGLKATAAIPTLKELTDKYSKIIEEKVTPFILEAIPGITMTTYVLCGAIVGKDRSKGVINKKNKVFSY
jgi:cholesterol oxidase